MSTNHSATSITEDEIRRRDTLAVAYYLRMGNVRDVATELKETHHYEISATTVWRVINKYSRILEREAKANKVVPPVGKIVSESVF